MIYTYREDQLEALDAIEKARESGRKSALVCKATGLGKTVVGCEYITRWINKFGKRSRILVLGHTELVFKEFRKHLDNMLGFNGYTWGQYSGVIKDLSHVQVLFGTFQTLTREDHLRVFKRNEFDLIVVDECHHIMAPTYKRVVDYFTPKFELALTATPDRMDQQNIRDILGEEVFNLTLPEAISRGGLLARVKYKIFVDNLSNLKEIKAEAGTLSLKQLNKKFFVPKRDEDIAKQIVSELKGVKNPRVLVFCPSIDYAKYMAGVLYGSIKETTSVVSSLSKKVQNLRLDKFRSGEIKVLCAVDMLNEVLDIPEITHLVFLRSTQSYTILLHQLGRGLRLLKSNPRKVVKVLDFVCSFERIKMISEIKDQIVVPAKDRDPFEVNVDHGNFKSLSQDVDKILYEANPFWSVEEVITAWRQACEVEPKFKTKLWQNGWKVFKKKHSELKLPSFFVLKRWKQILIPLGVKFVMLNQKNIPFTQVEEAWQRACKVKPEFKTKIWYRAWYDFKKLNPKLKLPCYGVLKHFKGLFKSLGVELTVAQSNNIKFIQVNEAWKKACKYKPEFKTRIYGGAWENLRKQHPELKLPGYKALIRHQKDFELHGVNFIQAVRYNIPFADVKRSWQKACKYKPEFVTKLWNNAWVVLRKSHPELNLPSFTVLVRRQKEFKLLGVEFVPANLRNYSFTQVEEVWQKACKFKPEFKSSIYQQQWFNFRKLKPELKLPSFNVLKKYKKQLKIKGVELIIAQEKNVSFAKVKKAWECACRVKPEFKTKIWHSAWRQFRKSHPELNLPAFCVLERCRQKLEKLGLKFIIAKQYKFTLTQVVETWKKVCKIEPQFKTKIWCTRWSDVRKSYPELHLPNYSLLKRYEKEFKKLGVSLGLIRKH